MLHTIATSGLAAIIAGYAVWYFGGAIAATWRTRHKRRSYGQMVTVKPHRLRHPHYHRRKRRHTERH